MDALNGVGPNHVRVSMTTRPSARTVHANNNHRVYGASPVGRKVPNHDRKSGQPDARRARDYVCLMLVLVGTYGPTAGVAADAS